MDKEQLRAELDALTDEELDARFHSTIARAEAILANASRALMNGEITPAEARKRGKKADEGLSEIKKALKRRGR